MKSCCLPHPQTKLAIPSQEFSSISSTRGPWAFDFLMRQDSLIHRWLGENGTSLTTSSTRSGGIHSVKDTPPTRDWTSTAAKMSPSKNNCLFCILALRMCSTEKTSSATNTAAIILCGAIAILFSAGPSSWEFIFLFSRDVKLTNRGIKQKALYFNTAGLTVGISCCILMLKGNKILSQ